MFPPLRVLIVDDAVTYRRAASAVLADLPGVEVVGAAANGKIALQRIEQLAPDLLLLDLEMPEIDGLELLRRLRAAGSDIGAIMLSAGSAHAAQATLEALELGALDFVLKPSGGTIDENLGRLQKELRQKIDDYVRVRTIRQILRSGNSAGPGNNGRLERSVGSLLRAGVEVASGQLSIARNPESIEACPANVHAERPKGPAHPQDLRPTESIGCVGSNKIETPRSHGLGKPEVVALGISTGGPQALVQMLPKLSSDFRVPVLIVQHMPPIFTRSLANDLDQRCALRVCEAAQGQRVLPGWIYIAPGGKQMKVSRDDGAVVIELTDDPPENSCRPSVDYLFRSVAEVYRGKAVGVIMTGMGNDGTRGCRLLKQQGAPIVAQDQATCVVFGMPKELVEQGIADVVAPLDGIAAEITRLVGKG
jgi:two-component system chemotaxis response regulator CheB